MKKESKKRGTRKIIWTVVYIMLVAILVGGIIWLLGYLKDDTETKEQYESIAEEVVESVVEIPETVPEGEKAALPVNFEELWKINPEIYAWIQIPDTNVDYPIVQRVTDDQEYYLTHNIYGEEKTAGSIYTEYYNSTDFNDPNTIIYGHNMKNGSMFHNLRYFAEEEYFEEHKDLYIYTPDRILVYEIFTSYEYDDRHLLGSFDFWDEEVYASYLEELANPRSMYTMFREGTQLDTDSRIVTLSTCVGGKPSSRRLVQAVLVNELEAEYQGETQESTVEQTE